MVKSGLDARHDAVDLSTNTELRVSQAVDGHSVCFSAEPTRNSLTEGSTKFVGVAGANIKAMVDQLPDVTGPGKTPARRKRQGERTDVRAGRHQRLLGIACRPRGRS